jgi:hypothetical protein
MTPQPAGRIRAWLQGLLIGVFLLTIGSPLLIWALDLHVGPRIVENRDLRKMPPVPRSVKSLIRFPRRVEAHWNDTFGFRPILIRWHSMAKMALGMNPSRRVTVGKGGWLFLADSTDYYRGTRPFTTSELEEWRRELEARHDWLAARGVPYLFVVAPEKESIYGEFMPDGLNRVRPERRLDQLARHLARHSRVRLLDLRPALSASARDQRIYHRTDTHWNDHGALVAAREVAAHLSEWLPEMRAQPAALQPSRAGMRPGGELAGLLGLQDRLLEHTVELMPHAPCGDETSLAGYTHRRLVLARECPGAPGSSLLLLHDSFGPSLLRFLAPAFRRTVSAWTFDPFDPALVEREAPDVLVHLLAERRLMDRLEKFRLETGPALRRR